MQNKNPDTIYGMFKEAVRAHGEATAIIEDEREITFDGLSGMVDTIANTFPAGISGVGIVMSHGAKMIAAILATLKLGARYVPAEPAFPCARIRNMMDEAGVNFILTDDSLDARLKSFEEQGGRNTQRNANGPTKATETTEAAPSKRSAPLSPDPPAYVLYTSGTTGIPKGVCVTNGNVCNYVRAFAQEFQPHPGDVMLQQSVCSFDIFVEEVFGSLLAGAALAIPPAGAREDTAELMRFAKSHGVTMLSGFPYLLEEINRQGEIPPAIRLFISGGDVLRESYVGRLLQSGLVYNTYGPSETTVCATYYCCNSGHALPDGTYPIGKPIAGVSVEILDAKGNPADDGDVGEICISGKGVSLGYIGEGHEKENEAFVHMPGGRVIYRSGDMGYRLSDGNIVFLHRKDDQIMVLGRRVEVSEVESRLCQCKGVDSGTVASFRDEGGLSYMVGYIVSSDRDIKVSDIRKELSENLPSFMIPEFFVTLPEIPINENGKVDAERLPKVLKEAAF